MGLGEKALQIMCPRETHTLPSNGTQSSDRLGDGDRGKRLRLNKGTESRVGLEVGGDPGWLLGVLLAAAPAQPPTFPNLPVPKELPPPCSFHFWDYQHGGYN